MKVSFAPYHLRPRQALNARTPRSEREGALLKVETDEGVGYADLFPWPDFGDLPLARQIEDFRSGRRTSLMERSLALARKDAKARAQGVSLGEGLSLRNNALLSDPSAVTEASLDTLAAQGFQSLKLKCGADPELERKILGQALRIASWDLRLDFNAAPAGRVREFMASVPREWDSRIQYVEDPSPFDPAAWNEIRRRWPVAIDQEIFRFDRQSAEAPFDVLILKPARQAPEDWIDFVRSRDLRLTVTSNMDHAVGVAHAVAAALEIRNEIGERALDAGCLTLEAYSNDPFAAAFPARGPFLEMPAGLGIGFDSLLEETSWTPLSER